MPQTAAPLVSTPALLVPATSRPGGLGGSGGGGRPLADVHSDAVVRPGAAVGPSSFPAAPARQLLLARLDAGTSSLTELAAELGLPLRTLTRVLSRHRLRWDCADRVAVALGLHPCQIWPEWFPGLDRRRAAG